MFKKFKKYGPNTKEVKSILAKLSNPGNRDVLEVFKWVGRDPGRHWRDAYEVMENSRTSERFEYIKWELFFSFAEIQGLDLHIKASLQAIVFKSLPGVTLTQEHYDALTFPIREVLEVVGNTTPGSPQREIVCSLIYGGATASEAINTANLALLV